MNSDEDRALSDAVVDSPSIGLVLSFSTMDIRSDVPFV